VLPDPTEAWSFLAEEHPRSPKPASASSCPRISCCRGSCLRLRFRVGRARSAHGSASAMFSSTKRLPPVEAAMGEEALSRPSSGASAAESAARALAWTLGRGRQGRDRGGAASGPRRGGTTWAAPRSPSC
jgi:hypothetical protein